MPLLAIGGRTEMVGKTRGWVNPGTLGEGAGPTGEGDCPGGGYPNCNLIANLLLEVVREKHADHHDGGS
jgi:hypothetical protein